MIIKNLRISKQNRNQIKQMEMTIKIQKKMTKKMTVQMKRMMATT